MEGVRWMLLSVFRSDIPVVCRVSTVGVGKLCCPNANCTAGAPSGILEIWKDDVLTF